MFVHMLLSKSSGGFWNARTLTSGQECKAIHCNVSECSWQQLKLATYRNF
jgi:hypothetical protein